MRISQVHIAGIGLSGLESPGDPDSTLDALAVSAGAKALLDAGVTYDDVDQGVACFLDEKLRIQRSSFNVFGFVGAPICEVDNHSGLFTAFQCVRSGPSNCVMVIGIDQEASQSGKKSQLVAVAVVLVSNLFLTSHAYLKDSAVCIRACSLTNHIPSASSGDPRTAKTAIQAALRQAQLESKDIQILELRQRTTSNAQQALSDSFHATQPGKSLESFTGTAELAGICGLVWQLRGWAHDQPVSDARNCLQYTVSENGTASVVILCRSDGKAAPAWSDIKNVRDGRERLGHNPATEMRPTSREDLEAVRARDEFRLDDAVKQIEFPVKGGDRAALARL